MELAAGVIGNPGRRGAKIEIRSSPMSSRNTLGTFVGRLLKKGRQLWSTPIPPGRVAPYKTSKMNNIELL